MRGAGCGGGGYVCRGEGEGVLDNGKDKVVIYFAFLVPCLRSFDPLTLRDVGILR